MCFPIGKKHLLFHFFLLAIIFPSYAQRNGVLVEYQFSNIHYSNKEVLVANANNSKYSTKVLDTSLKKEKMEFDPKTNNYTINLNKINIPESEMFFNNSNDACLLNFPQNSSIGFIIDSMPKQIWNIVVGQGKKVGPYNCEMAESNFRGTDIIAYFTTELPFNFGPWKFKGLPGIILEAQVKNSPFNEHWIATKVQYPIQIGDSSISTPIIGTNFTSYRSYIISKEKAVIDRINQLTSRMPQGTRLTKVESKRTVIEKKFEWE